MVGNLVGFEEVGRNVGRNVGSFVGTLVGAVEGEIVTGDLVGACVGLRVPTFRHKYDTQTVADIILWH